MRTLTTTIALAVLLATPIVGQSRLHLPAPLDIYSAGDHHTDAGVALNAAGEYSGMVGRVQLSDGAASATCSSAGCALSYPTEATATWADAGTTVRVGIQDVNTSTGFPDGTFDVYHEAIGTDPAPSGRLLMETGTKTITAGDIVVLIITMTTRASTDQVNPDRMTAGPWRGFYGFPYGVANTGSPAKTFNGTPFLIEFDDGTVG